MHITCGDIDKDLYEILVRSTSSIIGFHCTPCREVINTFRSNAGLPPLTAAEKESTSESEDDCDATSVPVAPATASTSCCIPTSELKGEGKKSYAEVASSPAAPKGATKKFAKNAKDETARSLADLLNRVKHLEGMCQQKGPQRYTPPPNSRPGRERCLIVMNAPESVKDTPAERILDDQEFLQGMVSRLFEEGEDGINVVSAFRLGRRADDINSKPRPLKVVLSSEEECRRVFSRCQRLKGECYRVLRDLSPEDRVRMRKAVQELKQRKQNGEENLHIVDFQVVVRRPRVVWHPLVIRPRAAAQPTCSS